MTLINSCIVDLFNDELKTKKLVTGLPRAFEMAAIELPKGNPAVGFLREHSITAFFISIFGVDKVEIPDKGNLPRFDIKVCNQELSIKTVTGGSADIKVLWTVDNKKVSEAIDGDYVPDCDMFLTQIYWGKTKESVFYIPVESQISVYDYLGGSKYLRSATNTNNRGISLSKQAKELLLRHADTLRLSVSWDKVGLEYTPYTRWIDFWGGF